MAICRFADFVKQPVERFAGLQVLKRSTHRKKFMPAFQAQPEREVLMIPSSQVFTEEATPPPQLQSPLLTINQVAVLLGISRCKVYTLMNVQGLPYTWVGEHRRIRLDTLHWWLEQQECSTSPVIQKQLEARRAAPAQRSTPPKQRRFS